MRTLLSILILIPLLVLPMPRALHAQSADSLMRRGQHVLDRGVTAGDEGAMQQARALFERVASASDDAAWAHYYIGLANYRIAGPLLDSDEERAETYLDDGIDHLQAAVDRRPDLAEGHALLGTLYGMKARGGAIRGMRYGPRADEALARARTLAPNNPRVILLNAVSLLNKPSRWGGDREKAVAALQRALQHFESVPPAHDGLQPQWGHADTYVWLGIAHMKADRAEQARAAFEHALAVRPRYAWVESGLLPQLTTAQ